VIKAEFSASFIIIINVENSCAAVSYFFGNSDKTMSGLFDE